MAGLPKVSRTHTQRARVPIPTPLRSSGLSKGQTDAGLVPKALPLSTHLGCSGGASLLPMRLAICHHGTAPAYKIACRLCQGQGPNTGFQREPPGDSAGAQREHPVASAPHPQQRWWWFFTSQHFSPPVGFTSWVSNINPETWRENNTNLV